MDESLISEELHEGNSNAQSSNNGGWQKVTYKRQRKPSAAALAAAGKSRVPGDDAPNVFLNLEQHAEDRRRRAIEAQMASLVDAPPPATRSKRHSDDDDDSDEDGGAENEKAGEAKKSKPKKPKKPKVTVAEAASKINADDLAAFIADVSVTYESQQEIQLMRFADYFGRAFAAVSSSQFPWTKVFRESPLAKIADIPISHISEAVYKTSVDWINQRSPEALGSFVLWSFDSILTDLASHLAVSKGSKKGVQQPSSKSQVAIFVALAMVLRRKPDVLVSLLPELRENSKYQGHDKLPVIAWVIAQASQGDLAVGLFSWARNLLPIVSGKSCNPLSRDLVLQSVERILSAPKARPILVNGAVRKGERLIPPSAFDILIRVTFPAQSTRVKATERFEAIYLTLKEVALAGAPGSKAMKQVSQQLLSIAVKAAGERIPELSTEAAHVFVWCLTQNADCYKQWDNIYLDNLEVSVTVLKMLNAEWKEQSAKQSSLDSLRETLKSFRRKNEDALAVTKEAAHQALLKDGDKHSKILLSRLTRSHGCLKGVAFAVIALAVGAAVMSPDLEALDWNKFSVLFSSQPSF